MTGARQHKVREIDFRRPTKFAREHIRRLENAHESFCRSASSRLTTELRSELQLDVVGTDQLPYGAVMTEEVPSAALVTVLRIEPLGTEILLVTDRPLTLTFVERLLGGGGAPAGGQSGLTDVELAVGSRAIDSLIESLSSTWLDLAGVTLTRAAQSTLPMSVQIVPPSEPSLLLNFSARIDGQQSIVTLMLPHRSVEPILHRFEMAHFGDRPVDDSAEVRAAVRGVEVELRAEVAAVDLPLQAVLSLTPGQVVSLRQPAAQGVVLSAADIPAYAASPGRNGNHRAVQVRRRWEEE